MAPSTSDKPASSRRWQLLTISLILLGLLLIGFFGLRAVRSYIRIQQTGLESGVTEVEAIRGWMTIPYIATAYSIPEAYIFTQLNLAAEGNQDKSLAELNRTYARGQPGVILDGVKMAVKKYLDEHPQPTRGGP